MSKDKVRDLLRTNPKYISIFIYIYDENGDNKSVLFYDSKKKHNCQCQRQTKRETGKKREIGRKENIKYIITEYSD